MIEQYFVEFITISLLHTIAVISPGPDFAIVLRQSIVYNTRAGLMTSLGIAVGILIHVAYCLMGIGVIISQSIFLFNIIKYMGAAYLIFLGLKALLSKKNQINPVNQNLSVEEKQTGLLSAFLVGLMTNIFNPKATLFFLAIFTSTVSTSTPLAIQSIYGLWLALVTFIWFGSVALFLSHDAVRNRLSSLQHMINRFLGAALLTMGLRVAIIDR